MAWQADGHRYFRARRRAPQRGGCVAHRQRYRDIDHPPALSANYLETSIVIESRKGEVAGRELDLLLYRAAIEIAPVDQDQVDIARHAWRLYGKGRHQAGLNYGDCFAYALAKQRSLPLLFCGDDFARTDIAKVPF